MLTPQKLFPNGDRGPGFSCLHNIVQSAIYDAEVRRNSCDYCRTLILRSQGICGVKEEQAVDGCPGAADGLPTDIWDIFIDMVDNQPSKSVTLVLYWRGFTERAAQWRR